MATSPLLVRIAMSLSSEMLIDSFVFIATISAILDNEITYPRMEHVNDRTLDMDLTNTTMIGQNISV